MRKVRSEEGSDQEIGRERTQEEDCVLRMERVERVEKEERLTKKRTNERERETDERQKAKKT